MIHRKWHEWFAAVESFSTTTYWDGSYTESKHYQCFCGHQWKIETEYNCEGFKVSEVRRDYKEGETK